MPGHFRRIAPRLGNGFIQRLGDGTWISLDDFTESSPVIAADIPRNALQCGHSVLNSASQVCFRPSRKVHQRFVDFIAGSDTASRFESFHCSVNVRLEGLTASRDNLAFDHLPADTL